MTKSAKTLNRLIKERDVNLIEKHGMKMKAWFSDFDATKDAYVETLTDDTEIAAASSYYDEVYDNYMDQLDALNSAMDSLTIQKPVVVEQTDPDKALSAISQIINLPKMDLEPFDGTASKYQRFMAIFKQLIEPSTPDPTLRLTRLLTHTTGDANTAISSIDPGDSRCYERALTILKEQFGSKYIIATSILSNLNNGPIAATPKQIRSLAYELKNAEVTLTNENMYSEINTQTCVVSVCKRLSKELREKWTSLTTRNQRKHGDYLSFSEFVSFVEEEAGRLNDPVFGREAFEKGASSQQRTSATNSFAASAQQAADSSPPAANVLGASSRPAVRNISPCILCSNMHKLFYCNDFRTMSLDERMKFVSDKKLCSLCLYSNHTTEDCRKTYHCTVNNCRKKHCRFLHPESETVHTSKSFATANIDVMSRSVLMPIVPIIVNNCFHTYALLDTGSTHTFCSRRLVNALDLDGQETTYNLVTLNGEEKKRSSIEVGISLQSKDQSNSYDLRNVLVTERIPVSSEGVNISSYAHLKDFSYPGTNSVDILIGQNYADLLLVHEYRRGGAGEPYAARTSLGWCVNGSAASRTPSSNVVSHLIATTSIEQKLDLLYEFEQDGLHTPEWSVEDSQVVNLWKDAATVDANHICLPIPWKSDDLVLPNNYFLAKHRLDSLRKSLIKKNQSEEYDSEIQQLVVNNYAELVPSDQHTPTRCWYLPHHAVPKKTKSLRVVFDCLATYKGHSLNSSCLQGPKFTSDLFDVLLRFRQYNYAIMADIQHMYNQVRIPESDRDSLRFLWYNNGQLTTYRMKCFIFGGVFCASGSSYALQTTADLSPSQQVKDVLLRNFYVDDLAFSSNNLLEAEATICAVRDVLSQRFFRLTKFLATDPRVLHNIPTEDHLDHEERHIHCQADKALGLGWNVKYDKLYITSKLKHATTRAELLSSLAAVFDPLGLITPLTIYGKLIFQDTSRLKLQWQSSLPTALQEEWNSWVDLMQSVGDISVSRCLVPPQFQDGVFELHVFSDASTKAYGSVVYLRCLNKLGQIHVVLVCSKNRVAPLKVTTTIPRMELQSAVLSSVLERAVMNALTVQLLPTSYWTDSMITLGFIKNTHRRFHTYVANRINKIRQTTHPEQ